MKDILFELRCKTCNNFYLYHPRCGNDFRCTQCKRGESVEAVQKEIEEMSQEEYQSFMDDIKEYEDELEEKRSERVVRKKDSQRSK